MAAKPCQAAAVVFYQQVAASLQLCERSHQGFVVETQTARQPPRPAAGILDDGIPYFIQTFSIPSTSHDDPP
jgi:hypothetical protein